MVAGLAPAYDASVQYVVEVTPFLLEYLESGTLDLEVNTASGWDFAAVGLARVQLSTVRARAPRAALRFAR